MVEPTALRASARRARVALYTVAGLGAALGAVVSAPRLHPVAGAVVGLLVGVVLGAFATALVLVWPAVRTVWHWSAEIVLVLGLVWTVKALTSVMHPVLAVVALVTVLCVPTAWPVVRRRLAALVWCAVVRHRLRLCFAEFIRSANRVSPGRLPLILWARPTPAGERVWLWLRPGFDLTDLDGKTGKVAVACWAGEARVVRASARFAALLRVDVTRRDPLTGVVTSPLVRLIPGQVTPGAAVGSELPPLALDLPEVPEATWDPRARR